MLLIVTESWYPDTAYAYIEQNTIYFSSCLYWKELTSFRGFWEDGLLFPGDKLLTEVFGSPGIRATE